MQSDGKYSHEKPCELKKTKLKKFDKFDNQIMKS